MVLLAATFVRGQFKGIVGFDFYNNYIETEYSQSMTDNALNTFYLAPQFGIQYDWGKHNTIRYQLSVQLQFPRFYADNTYPIYDIRSLSRLNYLYRFKNGNYVTGGTTYLNYKSELYNFPGQKYSGTFGLNIGFGKEYKYGFWEVGNLFALEFSELTPASLFGYWVVDFGYYIPFNPETKSKTLRNEKTIFGFGLVGALSYFNYRWLVPSANILKPYWGVDVHVNINRWNTAIFWRRQQSVTIVPGLAFNAALQTQWNNIGLRQYFHFKNTPLYATVSWLSGYDAASNFPETPNIEVEDFSIRGFTLGAGIPVRHWAFELSADCYMDVPLPQIDKGFGWDRIKASVIYNLPIITK